MNAALDDLGITDDPAINADPPKIEPEEIEEEIEEEEIEDNPPGYMSYEDWIADGKDPDDWQGKNKYSQQYDLIQHNKEFKSELKGMNDLLRQTVDATTAMQDERYQQGLADAKAELAQALENNDAQAAVAAQHKIDNTPAPASTANAAINPIVGQFVNDTPLLDEGSTQFDVEFDAEFREIYNGKLRAAGVGPDTQLSERRLKSYLDSALKDTKGLFPEKFESPRNNRKTTGGKQKRGSSKVSAADNIKNVKIATRNPRDNNALMDTYNAMKDKYGQEVADNFAKKMGAEV